MIESSGTGAANRGIMDIRKKTVIIIGLTLAGLILVLLLLSEIIVIGEFNNIEMKSTENDMYRVMTAISYDLLQMDTMEHEWANNAAVRSYLANPNGSTGTLIDDNTFERLQYNVIIFFDASGTMVDGKMYNLNTHREVPLPASLTAYITPKNQFFERSDNLRLAGVIHLQEAPMFVSMRRIQQDGDRGPVLGSILSGRYFDQQVVYQISMLTNTNIGMFKATDPDMPADVINAIPKIPKGQSFFIRTVGEDKFEFNAPMYTQPVNETHVATYARINDIFDTPVGIVRMTVPRDIYTHGRMTTDSFVILLFVACLCFGIAILLLLESTVLSRISRMAKEVSGVGATGELSTRVSSGGHDEIGRLAMSVNWMLTELEAVHAQLKSRLVQTEDRYRIIFNANNDIVFVTGLSDTGTPEAMIEVNDAGCARLGYTRDEFLRLQPEAIFAADTVTSSAALAAECLDRGHISGVMKFISKSGEVIPVEVYAHIVRQLDHPAILAICHDITDRLRDEQLKTEAFQQIENNMEKFAILNDHIRNPLQVIVFQSARYDDKTAEEILKQVKIINEIVDQLDRGYLESEKIRNFLRKYYDVGKR
ncbi:MAG: hypothetical protein STSR0009_23210 [Methanoregula sp.]